MQQMPQMQAPMQFQTPGGGAAGAGPSMAAAMQPPLMAMKMKGLPFSVTKDEIIQFFSGYSFNPDAIKIGVMADGRLTGEAVLMFNTADDCQNAQARLDQKHIGARWVKLIRIVNDEYNNFENEQQSKYGDNGGYDGGYSRRGGYDGGYGRGRGGGRGGSRGRGRGGYRGQDDQGGYQDRGGYGGGGQTVRLSDFVNPDNRYQCLKMRGLPFSAGAREIRDFFVDFRVAERDITIDLN